MKKKWWLEHQTLGQWVVRPINPAYYIEDCRILGHLLSFRHTVVHCNPVQGRTGGVQGSPCFEKQIPSNENRIPAMRAGFPCENVDTGNIRTAFAVYGRTTRKGTSNTKFLSFSKPFYIKIFIFHLTLLLRKVNLKFKKIVFCGKDLTAEMVRIL